MKYFVESAKNDLITLRIPGTNYRNTFKFSGVAAPGPGAKVFGAIHVLARKTESISDGGNYVEPLFDRPRRMQGLVLARNSQKNQLVVQVGYEVTVQLPADQNVSEFPVGSRVGWDNADWPIFEAETPESAGGNAGVAQW